MSTDMELLAIERERLDMEKKRDKTASIRFIIGSVLLALGTTGASLYINMQQEQRSLLASEQQWIIPILFRSDPLDYVGSLRVVNELLSLNISDQMKAYLQGQKLAIQESKGKQEQQLAAENAALEEKKKQDFLAEIAKQEAEEARRAEKVQEAQAALVRQQQAITAAAAAQVKAFELKEQREVEIFRDIKRLPSAIFGTK